jgi:hypothetical protein
VRDRIPVRTAVSTNPKIATPERGLVDGSAELGLKIIDSREGTVSLGFLWRIVLVFDGMAVSKEAGERMVLDRARVGSCPDLSERKCWIEK